LIGFDVRFDRAGQSPHLQSEGACAPSFCKTKRNSVRLTNSIEAYCTCFHDAERFPQGNLSLRSTFPRGTRPARLPQGNSSRPIRSTFPRGNRTIRLADSRSGLPDSSSPGERDVSRSPGEDESREARRVTFPWGTCLANWLTQLIHPRCNIESVYTYLQP